MEHQEKAQIEAGVQAFKASERDIEGQLDQTEGLSKWVWAKDIKSYREGRRNQAAALNRQKQASKDLKAARAKMERTGKIIENVGMMNKQMYHREWESS